MWLLWILVIAAVVVAVVRLGKPAGGDGRRESPEEILKQRYARGEIGKDQFEKMLSDLRR